MTFRTLVSGKRRSLLMGEMREKHPKKSKVHLPFLHQFVQILIHVLNAKVADRFSTAPLEIRVLPRKSCRDCYLLESPLSAWWYLHGESFAGPDERESRASQCPLTLIPSWLTLTSRRSIHSCQESKERRLERIEDFVFILLQYFFFILKRKEKKSQRSQMIICYRLMATFSCGESFNWASRTLP